MRWIAYPRHRFVDQYGVGDNWHYDFHLKEVMQTDQEPYGEAWIGAGEHACPPQDVGGTTDVKRCCALGACSQSPTDGGIINRSGAMLSMPNWLADGQFHAAAHGVNSCAHKWPASSLTLRYI
ncbi:IS1096 element passenger TnpR family protein [Paraburkholderia phenoliruptrix]|uniref:IS1096 element passenger TnpR family protein n=1 Tax=Paraburkholderia phenoliruptrix TaxID=252970 RepID=UPI0035B5268C